MISELGTNIHRPVVAGAEMVIGKAEIGDPPAPRLVCDLVQINGVPAPDQKVVIDVRIVDRSPIVAEHQRGGLTMIVDDGVVTDVDVGEVTVSLNSVVVRRRGPLQVVNEVIFDGRVAAANVDAVGRTMDIVVQERALAREGLSARPLIIDIAILHDRAADAWFDQDGVV
jgi:hypothetical protein